jgi:hypothetical protein
LRSIADSVTEAPDVSDIEPSQRFQHPPAVGRQRHSGRGAATGESDASSVR